MGVGESTPTPPLHDVCVAPRYSTTRGSVRRPVRRAGGSPMSDDPSHRPCYRREIPCNHNDIAPRRCPSAHRESATPAIPQNTTDAPITKEATQTINDARPPRPATSRDRHARYTRREWVAHPRGDAALSTENPNDSNSKTTASNDKSKPNIKVYINSCIHFI